MSRDDRDAGLGDKGTRTTPISGEELEELRALRQSRQPAGRASLLVYHRDGVRVVPLEDGKSVVIGRSFPADVAIRDSSLSRRHACLELEGGNVWVEDLGSTNGTWLDGERVERSKVEPGQELGLGRLTATIHTVAPAEASRYGLASHDRFQDDLRREADRARLYDRWLGLALIRGDRRKAGPPFRWLPSIQPMLRSFDVMALYSPDTVELLLPELTAQETEQLADAVLVGTGLPLRFGVAAFPDHAGTAGELFEVASRALHRTSASTPICTPAVTSCPAPRSEADAATAPIIKSKAMTAVFETIDRVASSVLPVLIVGETGVGKEVVARAIHDRSARGGGPMVCINCGVIPEQLVESTLFGHEKGAFTGASEQSKGVFESASGGTVLLDEIGELSPSTQAALLRVLEEKKISRVGSSKEIEVDVRVVAATNRDLVKMCKAGEFRKDLYFRLNTVVLSLPPLRDRPEDIEPLALRFMARSNEDNGRAVKAIDDDAMELLRCYHWPGNVRELRNTIERAVVIANDDTIAVEDLPETVRGLTGFTFEDDEESGEGGRQPTPDVIDGNLKAEMDRHEADLIMRALEAEGWDRAAAAKQLGVSLRTLARRMQEHGIKRMSYER